ncbi:protein bicaudal C homolog 1-B-like isoform X1 [Clytia hemisphaerica]|uniref:SAM domain-containing protein n=2 Tax=Clytia hemisphaerica TaxID=252671 RepID=A0A7M5XEG1_9CNID
MAAEVDGESGKTGENQNKENGQDTLETDSKTVQNETITPVELKETIEENLSEKNSVEIDDNVKGFKDEKSENLIDLTNENDVSRDEMNITNDVSRDELNITNDVSKDELNITNDEEERTTERTNDTNDEASTSEDRSNQEERFRVDRKQLEALLKDVNQDGTSSGSIFFQKIEKATNTAISWPAKLKIGAKTRKDPYIKVTGLPEDRQSAKQMVLSIMDSKSTRVTLKMDVSFADHSHIIGKGGNTIKKVMKDTQCHIHFPDSNRTSSEKSNQVSIAGPPFCVESARRQIRELLPIVLKFEIPQAVTIPDSSSPVIHSISHQLSVNISFQQQLRSYSYVGCVKGLHSDPFHVRDAVLKVLEHLTGTVPVTVPVTTQVEIDAKHHPYVLGPNGANIRKIQQATGASIRFPDPNDPNIRKSTVTITGTIESAVTAKVYLLQYLPLILMFDVRDGESDHLLEQNTLNQLMANYDVQITVKPKPRQYCKSIIVKGHEKNALNIYKTRMHLIGEDPNNMPHLLTPLATLVLPSQAANTQMPMYNGMHQQHPHQPIAQHPNIGAVTIDTSSSTSTITQQTNTQLISPPLQSSSPQEQQSQSPPNRYTSMSPVGQKIVGIEMKIKRMSLDASASGKLLSDTGSSESLSARDGGLSGSKSAESLLDALRQKKQETITTTKEIESLALSGSWNRQSANRPSMRRKSSLAVDAGLNRSQDDLEGSSNLSLTSNHLINNVGMQSNPKFNVDDYEARKMKAKNAMQSQVKLGKVRTPTDAWSGYGFSNSMPESAIKELWNNRERRANKSPLAMTGHSNVNHPKTMASPTTSLDSSVSSSGSSSNSAHHGGMGGHQSPPIAKPIRRPGPPPGLADSRNAMDNIMMMNSSGSDYTSMLSPPDSSANQMASNNTQNTLSNTSNPYANITEINELFTLLGLEQYITAFEKEEVDLQTFMSLTDEELKELNVTKFGARKKMTNAIKDLQYAQNQNSWNHHNNNGLPSTSLPSSLSNGLYKQQPIHAFDVAAHSLRW